MSLGKITLLSMLLGLVVGFLFGALFPEAEAAGLVGAGTALLSVVVAGLIQPAPRRRR
jgi:hypothetical protein